MGTENAAMSPEDLADPSIATATNEGIKQCTKLLQLGAETCVKLEKAAMEEKQVLLDLAFDGTMKIDTMKSRQIVEVSGNISEHFGGNMIGAYLEDVCSVTSREGLSHFLSKIEAAAPDAAFAHVATFTDSMDLDFECELRIVGEVMQNVMLIGFRFC